MYLGITLEFQSDIQKHTFMNIDLFSVPYKVSSLWLQGSYNRLQNSNSKIKLNIT